MLSIFIILTALLEEERKAYRLQAEESTKQIQVLQGKKKNLQKYNRKMYMLSLKRTEIIIIFHTKLFK